MNSTLVDGTEDGGRAIEHGVRKGVTYRNGLKAIVQRS